MHPLGQPRLEAGPQITSIWQWKGLGLGDRRPGPQPCPHADALCDRDQVTLPL